MSRPRPARPAGPGLAFAACGLAALSALGCSGSTAPPRDASPEDARIATDGRFHDARPDGAPRPEAGPADAGPADADLTDAGPADADLTDAAVACQVGDAAGLCLDTALCDGLSTPGFCPGPAEIQCCTDFPWGCDPDAHPQPNAGLSEPPGVGGCPAGMVRVETFCIDRYEASLLRVLPGGATEPWSPYHNPGTERVRAVSLPGAVPQGYISGTQAAAACAEAGKRLCTDAEWLRACQGPSGWTYPYGPVRQPGLCNDARAEHPAVQYYGTSDPWIWSALDNACLNQLPDSLAPTGSLGGCVSAEGAYDLMGNLHEWTADPAGTFRGGFYVDTVQNGDGCLYRTTAHSAAYWDYSTGFRCCADP